MIKDAQALQDFFDINMTKMTQLMREARTIEFKIRIASELLASTKFREARSWEAFLKDPRKIPRKKLDENIQDIFKSDWKKLHSIKQIADAVAHADYRQARNRIQTFAEKYNYNLMVNSSDVGIILIENVGFDDGTNENMHYCINTSDENTILEEFFVFVGQNWDKALTDILNIAESELKIKFPGFEKKAAALIFSRGLKFGTRVNKCI